MALQRTVREQRAASSWVEHTHGVLDELVGAQEALAMGEAQARGFALTADESLATAAEKSFETLSRHLSAARRMTDDNRGQQRRIAALHEAMRNRVEQMHETIARARAGSPAAEIVPPPALRLSKHMHRELAFAIEVERNLLAARLVEHEAKVETFHSRIVSSSALALLLGISLYLTIRRQSSARREAEREARLFFENSIDMLAIANHTGRLERVNEAWTKTLGWTRL